MRKHRKSVTKVLLATMILTATMGLTAYAAEWKQDTTGWWYEQDGGGYATGWQWIDGKCYYFDTNGYMAANTEIDGYTLNADGQWTVDGIVRTQGAETETKIDIASFGYTNGVSNIAIEMVTASRADLVAKYGAETITDDTGRGTRVYAYANIPFEMEYDIQTIYASQMDSVQSGTEVKNLGGEVTVMGSPSNMVEDLSRDNLSVDEMANYLRPYEYIKTGRSIFNNRDHFALTYMLWDYPGYEIFKFNIY